MENEENSTESTVHDTDSYIQSLMVTNPLQEPVMRVWSVRSISRREAAGLDV